MRMRMILRAATITTSSLLAFISATAIAQRPAAPPTKLASTPADATSRIVAAAQALLATLDEAGRAKVQFPFDGPQKTRWSNPRARCSRGRDYGWPISPRRNAAL